MMARRLKMIFILGIMLCLAAVACLLARSGQDVDAAPGDAEAFAAEMSAVETALAATGLDVLEIGVESEEAYRICLRSRSWSEFVLHRLAAYRALSVAKAQGESLSMPLASVSVYRPDDPLARDDVTLYIPEVDLASWSAGAEQQRAAESWLLPYVLDEAQALGVEVKQASVETADLGGVLRLVLRWDAYDPEKLTGFMQRIWGSIREVNEEAATIGLGHMTLLSRKDEVLVEEAMDLVTGIGLIHSVDGSYPVP